MDKKTKKGAGGKREGAGRKKLSPELLKSERITFRCTSEEKEKIEKAKGDLSLVDFILSKIKEE
ncbi:MAG: hypothetical protein ACRCX2_35325 [Paraclostridium sp.]